MSGVDWESLSVVTIEILSRYKVVNNEGHEYGIRFGGRRERLYNINRVVIKGRR